MNKIENFTSFDTKNSTKKTIIFLSIIGIIGLSIRLSFFSYEVPIVLDAMTYFLHATDAVALSGFPDTALANNGWALFLSLFFGLMQSENFLDYSAVQRLLSMCLSVLTIIPVYLICKKFVRNEIAILGAGIFVLEPRIIQNSIMGITEPLYIILGSISLLFFLNNKITYAFVAFGFIAITTMVRVEGIFLLLPFSIMFFLKYKTEKKIILKFLLALGIFFMILLPMSIYKNDVRDQYDGGDGIFGRVASSANESTVYFTNDSNSIFESSKKSIIKFIQFIGWVQIPIFIGFLPLGIYFIFKNKNANSWVILLSIFFMLIPAFYAISKGPDTRYLYFLYPMFCVISVIMIEKTIGQRKKLWKYLIGIFVIIILTSIIFLNLKMNDLEYEKNAMDVARFLNENVSGVNDFHPEASYIKPAIVESEGVDKLAREYNFQKIKKFPVDSNSIEKFILNHKEGGLSHLIIDKDNQIEILEKIFVDENSYPYLEKIFDSTESDMKYQVKIFKINFDEIEVNSFEELKIDRQN